MNLCLILHPALQFRRVFAPIALSFLLAASGCIAAEPWPSQYLVKPWETERLTAADVVGPDAIVYPDFRRVGVPGGIPDLGDPAVRAGYKEFPVPAGADEAAIAEAINQAITHAKGGGKSIVQLAAGD